MGKRAVGVGMRVRVMARAGDGVVGDQNRGVASTRKSYPLYRAEGYLS